MQVICIEKISKCVKLNSYLSLNVTLCKDNKAVPITSLKILNIVMLTNTHML